VTRGIVRTTVNQGPKKKTITITISQKKLDDSLAAMLK